MVHGDNPSSVSLPRTSSFFRRLLFGSGNAASMTPSGLSEFHGGESDDGAKKNGLMRRVSRKVVPGLPRMQTFKRQQSEKRDNLAPVHPTAAERRALSMDRRAVLPRTTSRSMTDALPRASAPGFLETPDFDAPSTPSLLSMPSLDIAPEPLEKVESDFNNGFSEDAWPDEPNLVDDVQSITSSMIQDELETRWILNLSMHFRDKSNREKFFVTYREADTLWRRVTISLDYRDALENSLEMDLMNTKYQRDKSSKIYEAIRDSLGDISFYDSVTNLKLQTTGGRLHVHVAEDLNEIITYPLVRDVQHLRCQRVPERDIDFDSHMSGFVYKVQVGGRVLIKKEIPGPDTINEFIYEINALYSLQYSSSVIDFFGVVVDDQDQHVKGLLISYAERGTLVDVIYDHQPGNEKALPPLPWPLRAMWARQVVQGLADIHESGFVQGDFTLSNIVIDGEGNARIIDINRRGCPVGWEPPEARPLIKSSQGISMYIGVKSDLYQLGMVLWALAMEEDEPEKYAPGLVLDTEADAPAWYRRLTNICLSDDARMRSQASFLLSLFPTGIDGDSNAPHIDQSRPPISGWQPHLYSSRECQANEDAQIQRLSPSDPCSYNNFATPFDAPYMAYEPPCPYPARGRSPPSPLPSIPGQQRDLRDGYYGSSWIFSGNKASYSDAELEDGQRPGAESRIGTYDSAVAETQNCYKVQVPLTASHGAEVGGRLGDDQGTSSHQAFPEIVVECPELTGRAKDVATRDGARFESAVDRQDVTLNGKSTVADEGVVLGLADNVGSMEGDEWNFAGGLGIMPNTGNTVPSDPASSRSQEAANAAVQFVTSVDRPAPIDHPTGPALSGPNTIGGPQAAAESPTPDSKDGARTKEGHVEEMPQSSPPHDDETSQSYPCDNRQSDPRSSRTLDNATSLLTGVGGVDDDAARGDPRQFPTSLDEEPELMTVPTKMATMTSVQRGPERLPSPISVGH